jgi:hypothetical protein
LDGDARREGFDELSAVGGGEDAGVEHDDTALVFGAADEPAEALAEAEDGAGE